MKICSKCNKNKELTEFHKHPQGTGGRYSVCKMCRSSTRSVVKEMFHNAKRRAKERGLQFEITLEDLNNLNTVQNGLCSYTKQPLNWAVGNGGKQRVCPPDRASLDRIDSTRGYTVDNIQFTWDIVNKMKSHYDHETFVRACKLIALAH